MTSDTTVTPTIAQNKVRKPPLTLEEKLAKVTEQKAKIEAAFQAQQRRKRSAENKKKRADDNRRKILLGSALLEAQTESAQEALQRFLDAYLTRDLDRKLFGLPELPLPPLPTKIRRERVAKLGLAVEVVEKTKLEGQ